MIQQSLDEPFVKVGEFVAMMLVDVAQNTLGAMLLSSGNVFNWISWRSCWAIASPSITKWLIKPVRLASVRLPAGLSALRSCVLTASTAG